MRWHTLMGFGLGWAAALVILRGIANSKRLDLTHETILIPDLPPAFEGFRLLHLSDLHLSRHGARAARLLAIADEVAPDLVCLGGDYVYTALSVPTVAPFFRQLSARHPVVGILGNADYRPDISPAVHRQWASVIPLLINAALCLERDGERLWVAGVDDPHNGRDCLPAAMTLVPPEAPTILLAHSPEVILRPLDPRIRLILSGHTHGGQICLPGGRALYHNTRLPAKFSSGRHEFTGATLYVSRGIGSTRIPVRYNSVPEVTVFTLTRNAER